jgi:hypothetical protein
MKTHAKDIRLANNAGISLPVCIANARILNTDHPGIIARPDEPVTCRRCLAAWPKRYPWARPLRRTS